MKNVIFHLACIRNGIILFVALFMFFRLLAFVTLVEHKKPLLCKCQNTLQSVKLIIPDKINGTRWL
jgi:hypothetical protein